MNYRGKKVGLTGSNGFIGSALAQSLEDEGAEVVDLFGDIRDRKTFDRLDYSFDYLFHFAAPSSQVLFQRKPTYCMQTTLVGFMNAATAAKRHGIRLIYPSTGLLSMGEANEYARCKRLCEDFAAGKNMDALGIRIFATYGPGEQQKADYASVPYLFARDMVAGKSPVLFGDGNQSRDFIFIDDTVRGVMTLAEECSAPIIDLGSGLNIKFNDIISYINAELDDDIIPRYVPAPYNYVEKTAANISDLSDYLLPEVDFRAGIARTVAFIKAGEQ